MTVVAHLWQPVCPKCGERASERSALGDESGPHDTHVGKIKCASCGKTIPEGKIVKWALAFVEGDEEAPTPKAR